jgi:hypothetical protein
MASKIKMMKLLQEYRGFAEMDQRPAPQSPLALPVPQLRPRIFQPSLPKRKLNIRVDPRDYVPNPKPVEIIFLTPAPSTRRSGGSR